MTSMRKIIVIGCPGAGKSTFSRDFHNITGIPLYYLDQMYWNADKTTVEKGVFLSRLSCVLDTDSWILDGNYASTLELRLSRADTVFFLDYATEVCLEGVRARLGKRREDMPWVEVEEDAAFMEYIKTFYEVQRPKILQMLARNSDKKIFVFTDRKQTAAFLREGSVENETIT